MKDKCNVKGCTRKIKLKKHKLCCAHYQRYLRLGEVGKAPIRTRKQHPPVKIYGK